MKSHSLSNDSIIAPFGALAYLKYIRTVSKNTAGITSGLVYEKVCFSEKIPLANSVSQAKSPKEAPFEQFKSHLSIVTYSNGLLFSGKPLKFKGGCKVSDRLFCICGSGSRHPKLSQDRGGSGVARAGLADREVTSLAYEVLHCQSQGLDTTLFPQRVWKIAAQALSRSALPSFL